MTGAVHANRKQRRQLERDNARLPVSLVLVAPEDWPTAFAPPPNLRSVWRSRDYLVQVFDEKSPFVVCRLSVNRTSVDPAARRWTEGIPWEDLQRLKREVGCAHLDAVEIFPDDLDLVNVANMRHLWVLTERVPFAWRRRASSPEGVPA